MIPPSGTGCAEADQPPRTPTKTGVYSLFSFNGRDHASAGARRWREWGCAADAGIIRCCVLPTHRGHRSFDTSPLIVPMAGWIEKIGERMTSASSLMA
jgi:hypothetical protein